MPHASSSKADLLEKKKTADEDRYYVERHPSTAKDF